MSIKTLAASCALCLGVATLLPLQAVEVAAGSKTLTPQQIVEGLKARPSRGLSVKPSQAEIDRVKTIEDIRAKAQTRGLSVNERTELAKVVQSNPSVDLVIYFAYDSAKITSKSREQLDSLAEALKDPALNDAAIMIAGHTDAKGGAEYNQSLSERRADSVRNYLDNKHGITSDRLTVVGYGAEQPKVKYEPYAAENRRVQVINLTSQTTQNTQ
ncbi:MAG: OmpA family protein [Hyphomicrobium sp.]